MPKPLTPEERRAHAGRKLAMWEGYWTCRLAVDLRNSERLRNHADGPGCRNSILVALVKAYVDRSIEAALLKIGEAVTFVDTLKPGFKDLLHQKTPPGQETLLRIVTYRNKLLAHKEENSWRRDLADIGVEFVAGARNIYREIEKASFELATVLETLELPSFAFAVEGEHEFTDEAIGHLVAAANSVV